MFITIKVKNPHMYTSASDCCVYHVVHATKLCMLLKPIQREIRCLLQTNAVTYATISSPF